MKDKVQDLRLLTIMRCIRLIVQMMVMTEQWQHELHQYDPETSVYLEDHSEGHGKLDVLNGSLN